MTEPHFDLAGLRRHPDVEASNLFAVDATDRLLLDTAAADLTADPNGLVVIGDHYGALTLGAAVRFGASGIRTGQDALVGELALAGNAERLGLTDRYRSLPLAPELLEGARVVLWQAPKSLAELAEISSLIATQADPAVRVFLGGRVKYLTPAINEVLGRYFTDLQAGLARQKSRVITAGTIRAGFDRPEFPERAWHAEEQLWVCAHGGVFGGTAIDIGTRRLVSVLDRLPAAAAATTAVDLGCGTGVLATLLARQGRQVVATDQSAAACASARATAAANQVDVTVRREDALAGQATGSADLVVCNPPFHLGGTVHPGAAGKLFSAAARVLRPGGELWVVYNSHLAYRPQLQRLVGPTRQVHRDAKFTVTASVRRP